MTTLVAFRNERTGEIKSVKVGWSWTQFLFGTIFGIPFWIRKVYPYAAMILAWDAFCAFVPDVGGFSAIIRGGSIGLSIILGQYGNKFTAEYYLKNGWEFVDPESDDAMVAREKWALA